ncbi:hypothetical protein [Paraburkholderia sp. GAS348]|uniref:hypothetical protein n=1 Tax=Paraburkholderia sp. GAS348 TaxID=3035132 RepID=UPI003D1A8F84
MKLSGDRNRCGGCGEYFNSSYSFDRHRTGDFGKDRRCMTAEEMTARGMVKNKDEFWITATMDSDVIAERRADSLADEN